MSIIRRLAVFSRRLPHSAPELFWHGTSSINLRPIMLSGLDPSKIKLGNWREDKNTNEMNPSKISYGGIYYTKSMFTAYTYGTSISRKYPGSHPLIIAVKLQELSAVPDEDSLAINGLFFGFINQSEIRAAEIMVNLITHAEIQSYNGDKYSWHKYIENFRQLVLDRTGLTEATLAKRQDAKRVLGAIDAILLACCRRYLAHVQKRPGYQNAYYYIRKSIWDYAPKFAKKYQHETPEGTILKLPAKFTLPSPEQAEQAAAKSIDYFIHLIRHAPIKKARSAEGWVKDNRTLRTLKPIGFRGRNRIICILELVDETDISVGKPHTQERIKIHYGTVPPEFLEQYRDRISGKLPVVWLDKAGNEISRDPKETPMTTLDSRLTAIAQDPKSRHDKLFNEHGYSSIGTSLRPGEVSYNYFTIPNKTPNLRGLRRALQDKGYTHKKSGEIRRWTKGKHTIELKAGRLTHTHQHG